MRRFVVKTIVWLALLVPAGYFGYQRLQPHLLPKGIDTNLPVAVVEKRDLVQRVTIAGIIVPARKAVITAPYSGYVQKMFVKIGDVVKKGDPLVSITQTLTTNETAFPLRAPFSGTVVQVNKAEGEYVKEGDTANFILRIDDLSTLYVDATAAEMDRTKIKNGQEAVIKASAILSKEYRGVIKELSLSAQDKDRWARSQVEFPLKLEILNPDSRLRPGMTVLIDIIASRREEVLTLRHEYIYKEDGKHYVVRKDGKKVPVRLGLQNEESSEIVDGVEEGEQVRQVDYSELSKG